MRKISFRYCAMPFWFGVPFQINYQIELRIWFVTCHCLEGEDPVLDSDKCKGYVARLLNRIFSD